MLEINNFQNTGIGVQDHRVARSTCLERRVKVVKGVAFFQEKKRIVAFLGDVIDVCLGRVSNLLGDFNLKVTDLENVTDVGVTVLVTPKRFLGDFMRGSTFRRVDAVLLIWGDGNHCHPARASPVSCRGAGRPTCVVTVRMCAHACTLRLYQLFSVASVMASNAFLSDAGSLGIKRNAVTVGPKVFFKMSGPSIKVLTILSSTSYFLA